MIMLRVEIYKENQKNGWDEFINRSKNGTFLFLRDYMDYHRDRFRDYSLMVWNTDNKLIAVLPANLDDNILLSHAGLTFGGFITDDTMKMPVMLQVFEETLSFFKNRGVKKIIYKTIPHIYHRYPSEEDRYALFLCDARWIRCGALTVINIKGGRLPFQERRSRGIRKARQVGLSVCQTRDFEAFWQILADRLLKTHGTKPVHSLSEITSLRSRFPENIKLFACYHDQSMVGGVVIYESEFVAHVQYIAASDLGRDLRATDLIFDYLLNDYYVAKRYFDFGTSDEKNGLMLNFGLIEQKEGFGARVVAQNQYEISLDRWDLGRKLGV